MLLDIHNGMSKHGNHLQLDSPQCSFIASVSFSHGKHFSLHFFLLLFSVQMFKIFNLQIHPNTSSQTLSVKNISEMRVTFHFRVSDVTYSVYVYKKE